jgi:hypothetical protein
MSAIQPGTCRFCGCTEDDPCSVPPYGAGDTCAWLDAECTVCSNCAGAWAAKERAEQAARIAARPKKLTSWQVHEQILEERRARRRASRQRRKGRAA